MTPTPPIISIEQEEYEIFDNFMNNPLLIRFGPNEKVVTWRLVNLFNSSTGQNISFNYKFPKLMERFINNNPNYGIVKKVRNNGTTYIGIGLITDPIPEPRRPKIKINLKISAVGKRDRLKQEILQVANWNEIQLVNLGFILPIQNRQTYNIICIIKVAESNIIVYIYNKIYELNREEKIARATKTAFERAIVQDDYLSKCHEFPTYTNRYI